MANERTSAIDKSFHEYVERMKQIRILSTPSIDSIQSEDDYSRILFENFRQIGELAGENRQTIDEYLMPLINSKEPLSDEESDVLTRLSEMLMDGSGVEIDGPVTSLLEERLMHDADLRQAESDEEGDPENLIYQLDRKLELCYFQVLTASRTNLQDAEIARKDGLAALDTLLSFLDKDKFKTLSDNAKTIVMIDSRYGALLYESGNVKVPEEYHLKRLELLEKSLAYMHDDFYVNELPDYNWRIHEFSIYYYMTRMAVHDISPAIGRRIYPYALKMKDLWISDPDFYSQYFPFNDIKLKVLESAYAAEEPSALADAEKLYRDYEKRDALDFSRDGIAHNLDVPTSYLILMADAEMNERLVDRYQEISSGMLTYIFHISRTEYFGSCINLYINLLNYYREVPSGITCEDLCIKSMAAIHPPTYIHSNMVAKITACLVHHMLNLAPELFLDFPGANTLEKIKAQKTRIQRYAYHAALCHDIGKLYIIDTVSMYGRRLLETEYNSLKHHPDMGVQLAKKHASLRKYIDVIRGHHIWYDNSKGYPLDFNTEESPIKTIIDIVSVADCMDAATDIVGRSYNHGKTFEDYEREVIEGAGTRYAPYFPKIFADPKVREDLMYLLTDGRKRLYRETFKLLKGM